MSNYNPFKAAVAQLHTPEAIAYYKRRSEQDIQTTVIVAVKVGAAFYEAAVFAYSLGKNARTLYEATKPAPEVTAIVVASSVAIELYEVPKVIDAEIIESDPRLLSAPKTPLARKPKGKKKPSKPKLKAAVA
jgi:hypothetical protein